MSLLAHWPGAEDMGTKNEMFPKNVFNIMYKRIKITLKLQLLKNYNTRAANSHTD
jgi:hypothetical protein